MSKKPLSVDVHVGRRLEVARKSRGATQQELGAALGVTFQQIQKYLRGTNRISAGKLYEAALFLNVDIAYFFEGIESEPSTDHNSELGDASLNSRDMEYAQDLKSIQDPAVQTALKALTRHMKNTR